MNELIESLDVEGGKKHKKRGSRDCLWWKKLLTLPSRDEAARLVKFKTLP